MILSRVMYSCDKSARKIIVTVSPKFATASGTFTGPLTPRPRLKLAKFEATRR